MTHDKICEECKTPFTAVRSHSVYCSSRCKSIAFKKRKSLGHPAQPTPPPTLQMKTQDQPRGLDASTQWVLDTQKDRISELKNDIKEKDKLIEKLQGEKEKQREEIHTLQASVNAKPSGLDGFITNNPGLGEKALELFGPKLLEIAERLTGKQGDHPVFTWLLSQPEDVQRAFVELLEGLNQQPEKILDRLSEFKRRLIALSGGGNNKQVKSSRLGR